MSGCLGHVLSLLVTGKIAMETNGKDDVKIVVFPYICLDRAWSRVVDSWRTAAQKDFCHLPLSVVNLFMVVPVEEHN